MPIADYYSKPVVLDPNLEIAAPENGESYKLADLQYALLKLQQSYYLQGKRGIVTIEGWDAAGKGGAIKRIVEPMDPRGFRVHQIGAPGAEEQGRHYLYRFWANLPKVGRIAIFDRSWYGRVLVERLENLVPEKRVAEAYREINEFERLLVDDGIALCKIFIDISPEEQRARLRKRFEDPAKSWKLTPDDFRNLSMRKEYTEATIDMLEKTSSNCAPWYVLDGNDKHKARIQVLAQVLAVLGHGIDLKEPKPNPEVSKLARQFLFE